MISVEKTMGKNDDVIKLGIFNRDVKFTVTDENGKIIEVEEGTPNAKEKKEYTIYPQQQHLEIPITMDDKTGKFYISDKNVHDFIESTTIQTIDKRTTFATITLKNGFKIYTTSTSASVEGYDEKIGREECLKKAKDKIFELLGFLLLCVQPTK